MMSFLFKSTIFLAIFLGTYYLLLRQEKSFSFNRFFLIGSLIFSLILPFLEIPVATNLVSNQSLAIQLIPVESPINLSHNASSDFEEVLNFSWIIWIVYLAGVAVMSLRMTFNLIRILQMKRSGKTHRTGFHSIIINRSISEPFTFFKWIFIPDSKYLHDHDILNHELVHVREKHSFDIFITELIIIFFWFQPLVYQYRRAISLNHEFQADDSTIEHSVDAATYLHKLACAPDTTQWNLTSNFSFLFIKNRIVMINKKQSSGSFTFKASFVVLLSICISFISAFKQVTTSGHSDKLFTVVIDAGHGGNDNGHTANGLIEKDIVLAVSQKIKGQLESKSNIRVLVTRERDVQMDEEQRIVLSENADLFISLHTNTAEVEVIDRPMVVYQDRGEFSSLSKRAANLVASELQTCDRECIVAYSSPMIHEEAKCPVIELTLGYLNQDWFAENLSTELGQLFYAEKIARAIVLNSQ